MSVKSNGDNNNPNIDVNTDGIWYDWGPFFRPSFMAQNSGVSGGYCMIGKTVHYEAIIKFSPADIGLIPGTLNDPSSNTAMFTLPVLAKAPTIAFSRPIGTAYFTLLNAGNIVGEVLLQATDGFTDGNTVVTDSVGILQFHRASFAIPTFITRVQLTNTNPVTLYGESDITYHVIAFSGTYEAA